MSLITLSQLREAVSKGQSYTADVAAAVAASLEEADAALAELDTKITTLQSSSASASVSDGTLYITSGATEE